MFGPYLLYDMICIYGSKPYTLAFTNLPGPLRALTICGSKSYKLWTFFVPIGRAGLALGAISYAGQFKVTLLTDTGVVKEEPKELIKYIENNLDEVLKMTVEKVA